MLHIRSSVNGVFILENSGVPSSLTTDFGETIQSGSLCIDNLNDDLYILKGSSWQLVTESATFYNNGITDVGGGTIGLGGTLIEDTIINGNTQSLVFGENSSGKNLNSFVVNANSYNLNSYSPFGGNTGQFVLINPGEFSTVNNISTNVTTRFGMGAGGGSMFYKNSLTSLNSEVQVSGDFAKLVYGTEFSESGLTVTGSIHTFADSSGTSGGIRYADNYHSLYTNRSLVDKEYVDNVVLSGVSANNGLTEFTGGTIGLGGTLIQNTTIDADNKSLSVNDASNIFLSSNTALSNPTDLTITDDLFRVTSEITGIADSKVQLTSTEIELDYSSFAVSKSKIRLNNSGTVIDGDIIDTNAKTLYTFDVDNGGNTSNITMLQGSIFMSTTLATQGASMNLSGGSASLSSTVSGANTTFSVNGGLGSIASAKSVSLLTNEGDNSIVLDTTQGLYIKSVEAIQIDTPTTLDGSYYTSDYSTNGIVNYGDRWIPDLGYVKSLTSSISADNGLTEYSDGTIGLGGTLNQNTTISGDNGNYNFILNNTGITSLSTDFSQPGNNFNAIDLIANGGLILTSNDLSGAVSTANLSVGSISLTSTVSARTNTLTVDSNGILLDTDIGGSIILQADYRERWVIGHNFQGDNSIGRYIVVNPIDNGGNDKFQITDNDNNKGIEYEYNYSTNWTVDPAFDNVLVNKKYVDEQISANVGSISAFNGLTEYSDGTIGLGGSLTQDTTITGNVGTHTINFGSNGNHLNEFNISAITGNEDYISGTLTNLIDKNPANVIWDMDNSATGDSGTYRFSNDSFQFTAVQSGNNTQNIQSGGTNLTLSNGNDASTKSGRIELGNERIFISREGTGQSQSYLELQDYTRLYNDSGQIDMGTSGHFLFDSNGIGFSYPIGSEYSTSWTVDTKYDNILVNKKYVDDTHTVISGTNDFIPIFNSSGDNIEDSTLFTEVSGNTTTLRWDTTDTDVTTLNIRGKSGGASDNSYLSLGISTQIHNAFNVYTNTLNNNGVTYTQSRNTNTGSVTTDYHRLQMPQSSTAKVDLYNFGGVDTATPVLWFTAYGNVDYMGHKYGGTSVDPRVLTVADSYTWASDNNQHFTIGGINGSTNSAGAMNNNNAHLMIWSNSLSANPMPHLRFFGTYDEVANGAPSNDSIFLRDSSNRLEVRENSTYYPLVNAIGEKDLSTTASNPTASEDGQVLTWNNGTNAYTLTSIPVPTIDDKNQTASVTTIDGDSTGVSITNTPFGYVQVMVNGMQQVLGNGVKTDDCYFSGDGGTTARNIADIVATDILYWNGSIAGFELDNTYRIDLNYNT
jgi:hypothetical protein